MSRRAGTTTALAELRKAFAEMLGAERRLRSRDRPGEHGLTFAQLRALTCLHGKEEATAGELARFADVNPATMTAMLDQLETGGIVRRERRSDDRRVVFVTLTDLGRSVVEERHAEWDRKWLEQFGDLSAEEVAAAETVMRRLTAMLEAAGRHNEEE